MKENSPQLSIIIPVYNAEKEIEKCLESVINQTLKEIEIIIVNDCSTDNTPKILSKYQTKDKRIVLINNEKNIGTGASRNKGLLFARGEYVGFIDNDDYADLNYFEEGIKALQESNAAICVSLKIQNIKGNFKKTHLINPKDLREIVFVERTAPWSKIIKKDFLIKNGIKFDLTRGEDIFPAFLCAYYAKKITCQKKAIYYCNIRNNSVSHRKITETDLDEIRLYEKIFNFIETCSEKKYFEKLIKKRGLISFDFLYKNADKNLKSAVIREYKKIFKSKNPLFEYKIWKIQNFFEKTGSIIRAASIFNFKQEKRIYFRD